MNCIAAIARALLFNLWLLLIGFRLDFLSPEMTWVGRLILPPPVID